MDDSATGRTARAGQRGGRRHGAGSSVLTPPTGLPAVPDLDAVVPVQRRAPIAPPAPPKRPVVVDPCACGHAKAAHEHYRAGADCGVCGMSECSAFRPAERTGIMHRLFGRG